MRFLVCLFVVVVVFFFAVVCCTIVAHIVDCIVCGLLLTRAIIAPVWGSYLYTYALMFTLWFADGTEATATIQSNPLTLCIRVTLPRSSGHWFGRKLSSLKSTPLNSYIYIYWICNYGRETFAAKQNGYPKHRRSLNWTVVNLFLL